MDLMRNVFKRTPEQVAEKVAGLELTVSANRAEVERLSSQIKKASFDASEGLPGASEALAKLRKALFESERNLRDHEDTLSGAKEAYSEELRRVAEMNLEQRKTKCKGIGSERVKVVSNMKRISKELFKEHERLMELSEEQFRLTPITEVNFSQSRFCSDQVTDLVRFCLLKEGFNWARRSHLDSRSIPEIDEEIAKHNEWLMRDDHWPTGGQ